MTTKFLLPFAILFLAYCAPPKSGVSADLILYNGRFFTADTQYPNATAIAISADTILAVGTDEEMKKWQSEKS
ncbi:MAG: hypothetical protein JNJ57_08650 [Saprospiraceae bacterium]|nr:hypothetical protein [Saprospiraceae bacterium]